MTKSQREANKEFKNHNELSKLSKGFATNSQVIGNITLAILIHCNNNAIILKIGYSCQLTRMTICTLQCPSSICSPLATFGQTPKHQCQRNYLLPKPPIRLVYPRNELLNPNFEDSWLNSLPLSNFPRATCASPNLLPFPLFQISKPSLLRHKAITKTRLSTDLDTQGSPLEMQ